MYTISHEKYKVTGTDDAGNKTVLFDCTDRFNNLGCRPTRAYKRNDKGYDEEQYVMIEALFGHAENYAGLAGSGVKKTALLAEEFLLADRLIRRSEPLKIAMVDGREPETRVYPDIISWFNEDHRIFGIDSANHDGFCSKGFDVVIICADDTRAESELKAAAHLLSEDGLLLISSDGMRLFDAAIKLFIDAPEVLDVDTGHKIYRLSGREALRHWFEPEDLRKIYESVRRDILDCLEADGSGGVKAQDMLRKKAVYINKCVHLAQTQWDLTMKQAFLPPRH